MKLPAILSRSTRHDWISLCATCNTDACRFEVFNGGTHKPRGMTEARFPSTTSKTLNYSNTGQVHTYAAATLNNWSRSWRAGLGPNSLFNSSERETCNGRSQVWGKKQLFKFWLFAGNLLIAQLFIVMRIAIASHTGEIKQSTYHKLFQIVILTQTLSLR